MVEHHRRRPDLPDRIGDALPCDVGRRAVHRFEHRWILAFRVDIAGRRNADGAGARRTQVREDIAEQIRRDHDVERIGLQHEQRGENVDVELVPLHVGIALRHRLHALVPVRHGDGDAVRLRRGREMLLRRLLRQLERELQHAVDADAGQDRLLHDDLTVGAGKRPPADRRIFALGVLAHDPEIDVAGFSSGQRRRHARHQPHRPQVDVLVELAPEQNQRAPQRDVIRNFRRPADRTEEDRVMAADLLLPVLRHHPLVLFVIVPRGKIEMIHLQRETELGRGLFQNAHALRHGLLADTVAGDDRNAVLAVGGLRHRRGSRFELPEL
jgi:hypothetical protein